MSVADTAPPLAMAGEAERRDLDETGGYRRRWDDAPPQAPPPPPPAHPVRDIVIPLAVVITLIINALLIGVAWGRFSQRMDTYESSQEKIEKRVTDAEDAALAIRDRMRDAERDIKDGERRFLLLDDYTRGRVDDLPYKAPPPARW